MSVPSKAELITYLSQSYCDDVQLERSHAEFDAT